MTSTRFAEYLDRIGMTEPPPPTAAGLGALHLAHATNVPFENLDVLLGRPIRLDPDDLHAKLVRDRRGGYCFEQNLLLSSVLETIGFGVIRLAARVRYRAARLLPRTHMLLVVEAEGDAWLADVGFGGGGPLLPLRLVDGEIQRQFHWAYRLIKEHPGWVLQAERAGRWEDYYAFTLEPQELVDFEVANYYVSTHPDSPFTRTLAVQLPTPDRRFILRNRELTTESGAGTEVRVVTDEELPALLAATFGLSLPAGATIPDRPWGWGE